MKREQATADKRALVEAARQKRSAEEQERYTLKPQQMTAAIEQLLARLEQHYFEAALNFEQSGPEEFTEGPRTEEFVEILIPHYKVIHDRLYDALCNVQDPEDLELCDLEGQLFLLTFMLRRTSYSIGVLAGARLMGASSEKLRSLGDMLHGFIR